LRKHALRGKGSRISQGLILSLLIAPVASAVNLAEAPAGFGKETNGVTSQTQFELDLATFEEREEIADGLGPVYNAQACSECHQNPVAGATSQVSVIRVGRFDGRRFQDRPGGSLIQDRAIDPAIQERVSGLDNVQTFRLSLSVLGDGYVEAIPDSAFDAVRAAQPPTMKGTLVRVPVLEGNNVTRVGRFGWKSQHASLLSFSADAYLNEMGITSPLQPAENSSNGVSVAAYDTVSDPEDEATPSTPFGADVEAFARFMRSTRVPARDTALAQTSEAQQGEQIFLQLGCQQCHTPTFTTAPAGTVIHGGAYVIPAALGDKIIHPYSDFMLHDVGTGDGIVQSGGDQTRNKMRTPPLWGLRTRSRLMHDGASLTRHDAIVRHDHEARSVIQSYLRLSPQQRDLLMTFLSSL
jgi:CxxC motif-containing protein (DUF1111 family)